MKEKLPLKMIGGLMVITAVMVGGLLFVGQGPDQTPSQVVQTWIDVYPADLNKAAPLTTEAMRQGLSPSDWVKQSQETLGKFRYIGGQVVSTNVDGHQAEVLLDAEIDSPLGKQLQKEQFRLTLIDNNWAIEERAVVMVLPAPPPFF